MFVPAWIETPPMSAARNAGQLQNPSIQARAAPARTGMAEAVKEKGRRISLSAPARRRSRSPVPRVRSFAMDVATAAPAPAGPGAPAPSDADTGSGSSADVAA